MRGRIGVGGLGLRFNSSGSRVEGSGLGGQDFRLGLQDAGLGFSV